MVVIAGLLILSAGVSAWLLFHLAPAGSLRLMAIDEPAVMIPAAPILREGCACDGCVHRLHDRHDCQFLLAAKDRRARQILGWRY